MTSSRQYLLPVFLFSTGLAQAAPDAGSLLQQMEQGRGTALPGKSAPVVSPVPQPMKGMAGMTVTVSAFRFAGNTLLSAEQLAPAVSGFLNRPLDFAALQNAAAAVAEAYRKAGWIVYAYLPRQEIKDGIVTIQIVEAVFGGAEIEGDASNRVARARLLRMIESAQATGAPLNANAIDRALLLIDDLPGVAATGSLRQGKEERETDLVLKVAAEPRMGGEAGADNSGTRSTGRERVFANFAANSPLGLADQFVVDLIHSQGSDYGWLDFSLPVGSDGWRIGASASSLSYDLVAPEFSGLDARGTSSTVGVEASYPLIRSRLRNLYLSLNYDDKRFDNRAAGASTSTYGLNAWTVGLNGNLFDRLGGGGANAASLVLEQGRLDLDGSPNQTADAATTRSAGAFTKLRYAASRQQVVTDRISVYAAIAGQIASKNLDSAEKFYLGGAGGVRAYPASEAGGSEGKIVNLEIRARLPQNFNLAGFYDWGNVTVNRDNSFIGAAAINNYSLRGVGISLAWLADFGLSLKATWARRIGNNPNPTIAGNDQDGSLVRNRFWLQLVQSF